MTLANVTINTLLMNAINKSGQFILACTRGGKAARIVAPDPVGGFLLFDRSRSHAISVSLTKSQPTCAWIVFCVHPLTYLL